MDRPRTAAVGLWMWLAACPPALAQPAAPAPTPPSRSNQPEQPSKPAPLATVLGKPITLDDLRPPTEELELMARQEQLDDPEQWLANHRGELLRDAILSELGQKFARDHHLEATDAEIDEFERRMARTSAVTDAMAQRLRDLRAELANPGLSPEERAKLNQQIADTEDAIKGINASQAGEDWPRQAEREQMLARTAQLQALLKEAGISRADRAAYEHELAFNLRFQSLTDEQMPAEWKKFRAEERRLSTAPIIINWKINRELFKQYAGRILWQQAGIEPIDAVRQWLEEREKAGDFVLHEPALKERFWHYYKQDHGPFLTDKVTGHEFDEPWWLKPEGK